MHDVYIFLTFNSLNNNFQLPDPGTVLGQAVEYASARDGEITRMVEQTTSLMDELEAANNQKRELERSFEEMASKLNYFESENQKLKKTSLKNDEREELVNLRKELEEYEEEFKTLKNQDITIRKLEAQIVQLKENSQDEMVKELEKAQEELAETEGKRVQEALEREQEILRKYQNLELELKAERAGRLALEERDLKSSEGLGKREAGWDAQRQILVDDSERLREALFEVTRERDNLRLKVGVLSGSSGDDSNNLDKDHNVEGSFDVGDAVGSPMIMNDNYSIAERKAYEAEINELSLSTQTLREELNKTEETFAKERLESQAKISNLEQECQELSESVSSLKVQLENMPSQAVVDSMQHELRVLKHLEFNAASDQADGYGEDNSKDPEMTASTPSNNSTAEETDLESILVSRLRKMEYDLLKERREKGEMEKQVESLQASISDLEKDKDAREELVARLESDLSKVTESQNKDFSSHHHKQTYHPSISSDPTDLEKILDPDSIVNDNNTESDLSDANKTTGGANKKINKSKMLMSEKESDDHSVATIILAQRDRLRSRCDALEEERDSFKKELQIQVRNAENLKSDNTKLYEKVRYLQNFASQSNNTSRGGGMAQNRDLDLEALEERYEASVDPFRQFSRAERQRKMKEMSQVERIVFICAKTVLGSKEMRTGLFVYVLSMHFLVFITTYHWAHASSCTHHLENHPALEHFHGGPPINEAALLQDNNELH